MTAELAVIIVSWNTCTLTLDAIRTLQDDLDANGPDAEIWVVDNASTDGTPDAIRSEFPKVNIIESTTNLGFAGGNNHALRVIGFQTDATVTNADLPLAAYLLNSDTRTQPGATRALYDALLTLPRAGVVGAQLEYGDGSFQHGAFRFPGLLQLIIDLLPVPRRLHETRLNGRYPRKLYQRCAPFPVDHTLGATMMLKREVIQQTGMFDEAYFMYCEEIDWSMRIRRAGWEIYTVPAAKVTHLAGQSTNQIRPQSAINLWQSRMRLFEQYYSPLKVVLARQIIRLGMRYKIAQTESDYQAGKLSTIERDELIAAYRTVQSL